MHDVLIVGGSYAGLAAGLQLARARRKVAVVDSGQRRSRFASSSHGFLTRDGTDPAEIAAIAKSQLLAYPTVTSIEAKVVNAGGTFDDFHIETEAGETISGRRLILATGVRDDLPAIEGLVERWGRSVFHCPYCHGYEIDGPIGVLAASPHSIHHAQMLPDWGPTTYFLNGGPMPIEAELADLARRGTKIEPAPIHRLTGARADVELEDGRVVPISGLFTATQTAPSSPIGRQLGCNLATMMSATYIETDTMKQTSVAGIFACGDSATPFGSVTMAVADGAMAGVAAHRSLLFPPT
jgi:thioredoxin reductase